MCTGQPPAFDGAAQFQRGIIGQGSWWRQDPEMMQLIVSLPDGASFKRDVSIELTRKNLKLSVAGSLVLSGELAHDAVCDESEWFVEEGMDGFDVERCLVVDIKKRESFVDWAGPLKGCIDQGRRVLIGGKGEAQKRATAQQLASYQILQKLPSAVRGDIYARAPSEDEHPSDQLFFIGKVISEVASVAAALAAQEVLVKEHARLYLPHIFSELDDDDFELWLAPGNSEMRVAQNEVPLERWAAPASTAGSDTGEGATLPAAGECGFEPETAPPPHMGEAVVPFSVRRDSSGQPLSTAFRANVVAPDEVPGAYEKWLDQQ